MSLVRHKKGKGVYMHKIIIKLGLQIRETTILFIYFFEILGIYFIGSRNRKIK
jgi:hypothetical protein